MKYLQLLAESPETNYSAARPGWCTGLPVEIVITILKWLDCREILLCSSVCKTLRETVKESLELQYQIELAADGMVDGPPGLMTTADRLELLLDRRRRWRMLDWTRRVMVPIPGACQAYELVGGVFAKSMSVAHLIGSRHLIATWLPSRTKEARSIIRDELGVATRDFAIDPSQDLIALVDADNTFLIKVYLRTISTNTAHPGAASSELRAEIPFELGNSFIQLVDDVVGMFFWVHGAGLIVWNWVTAEVLVYCVGLDLPPLAWDFAFLSNRAFMITATGATPLFDALRTLRAPHRAGKPFASARDSRVHLMSLHYNDRGPRFHLFLHNRFLLSLVPPGFGSGEAWTTLTRPWDSWGPAHTRFLEHNVQFQWLRYVHGHRVVLPPFLPSWPNPLCTLCVIDFNIHPTRTDDPVYAAESRGTAWRYEVVTRPTTVSTGNVFQTDVVTHLPYSVSSRSGLFNYSGFMIDDERIVGMKGLVADRVQVGVAPAPSFRSLNMSSETTSKTVVEIPSTVATHVLGDTVSPPHTKYPVPPAYNGTDDLPDLTLTVGKAAFPLFKTTLFGTLASDDRAYVFTPELGGRESGYVKITLPGGVKEAGCELAKLQTQFEQVLIDRGFLKEGMAAAADELGKSVRDDSASVAQRVRGRTASFLTRNPPTSEPAVVPQSAASSSASGTQSIATRARSLSNAVSSAASQAGAWVAGRLVPTTATNTENLASVSDSATDSVGAGSAEMHSSLDEAAGEPVQNEYGVDARDLAGDVGASAGNVGTVIGDAALATAGAAGTQVRQQEVQDAQVEFDDGEIWKDVSI
ncbi:hypothetical protein B0H21DRAFT_779706 [Amylocystis lapponica]|nr:hypothetical protein B0H21DRAFT_779706 [Amylocystis lapponica]